MGERREIGVAREQLEDDLVVDRLQHAEVAQVGDQCALDVAVEQLLCLPALAPLMVDDLAVPVEVAAVGAGLVRDDQPAVAARERDRYGGEHRRWVSAARMYLTPSAGRRRATGASSRSSITHWRSARTRAVAAPMRSSSACCGSAAP